MSTHESAESVFKAIDRTLQNAKLGWRSWEAGGEERYTGFINAIIATRSVTNVIQNLRGKVDGFDEWWQEEVQVLNNPVAKWFVTIRNNIEKQGTIGRANHVVTLSITGQELAEMQSRAPAGTTGMFIGDDQGRSGYHVQLPDGSQEIVYFSVPREQADFYFEMDDAPGGKRVDELYLEWFSQVEGLATRAVRRFSSDSFGRPAT